MSDTLKKEFYLCPVTGMPFGENVNLEELKNEEIEKYISDYEFKGIKYSNEVQEQIDKGLVALVVVENKIEEDKIKDEDGVKYSSLDMSNAERTGDYAFVSKEMFSKMFGNKSVEEIQFITEDVFQSIVALKKTQELKKQQDINE